MIVQMFRLIETDQKDRIGYADLRRLAEELGEPLTAEEIHEMIQRADTDGDGYVDAVSDKYIWSFTMNKKKNKIRKFSDDVRSGKSKLWLLCRPTLHA